MQMRGSRTDWERLPRIVRIELRFERETQASAKGPNTGVHWRIETSSMTPMDA